ncbi:MAG: ROK family transcriptional regulator [Inquilinaceae bacterium]
MSLRGTNLEHARSYNRRVVLEAVRVHGPVSRAEITRLTSLSAQTVSNIALELNQAGLVRSTGRRKATRGQPPVELAIDAEGGFTVGLQLDHETLVAVLVDLIGAVRRRIEVPVDRPGPDTALPLMAECVERLIAATGTPRGRVLGVGVVMPGPFDVDALTSVGPTTLPGWRGVDTSGRLAETLRLPVLVENDATAAAIGERLYGDARGLRSFVYLFIGTGLGGGLILEGQPYKGAFGNAGEIGHIIVDPRGHPCFCGNRGCLERYLSLHAAHEAMKRAGVPTARTEDLTAALAAGSPPLLAWLDEAADRLRVALATIENMLDPEAILIGGYLPDPLADALVARAAPLRPSVSDRRERRHPRLIRASAGADATALGAALLPIFDRMNPSFRLLFKPGDEQAGVQNRGARRRQAEPATTSHL